MKLGIRHILEILGLLTIQQGQGFNGLQLGKIMYTDTNRIHNIKAAMETIRQFVDGNYNDVPGLGTPQGPSHIFHKSFADFLIDDANNKDYHIDPIVMHQKVVDYYLRNVQNINEDIVDWLESEDYSLLYLTYHLYTIIEGFTKFIKQNSNPNDITRAILSQRREYSKILYQLARSKTLKEAQKERFPGDSHVILSSTQRAISAAAIIDDAPAIFEFMINHAQAISEIKRESPLEAFRKKMRLEIAWNMADLYDIEICALWHFLLAWELKNQGDFEGSQMTLDRLSKRQLVRLSHNEYEY